MSTENSTSNFLAGSEENTLALAVPLIDLILPFRRVSASASRPITTSWPSFKLPRSSSPMRATTSSSDRSRISATAMPGCNWSPSRMSGNDIPEKKKPVPRFCLMATSPLMGANSLTWLRRLFSRASSTLALFLRSANTASSACACSRRLLMSLSSFCRRRRDSSKLRLLRLASISEISSLRLTSSSARRTE